jgi:hypothetical protein
VGKSLLVANLALALAAGIDRLGFSIPTRRRVLICQFELPVPRLSAASPTCAAPWERPPISISRITAQCGVTWRSTIGEEFPSTQVPYDNCSDLPMGSVKLERTDWNELYYFAGAGKNTEEIVLEVKKVETHQ